MLNVRLGTIPAIRTDSTRWRRPIHMRRTLDALLRTFVAAMLAGATLLAAAGPRGGGWRGDAAPDHALPGDRRRSGRQRPLPALDLGQRRDDRAPGRRVVAPGLEDDLPRRRVDRQRRLRRRLRGAEHRPRSEGAR